jgi:hypothetical protein
MSNPSWRTPTVVALCESMRQLQDYSALPILADALEESGYEHWQSLEVMRDTSIPLWQAERMAAIIYSPESLAAIHWIDSYAFNLGVGGYPGGLPQMTYQMLMEAARKWAANEDDGLGAGSMNWSNLDMKHGKTFWKMWALVTARTPPDDTYEFLSCSC